MKHEDIDWSVLRGALLTFSACLLVSAGIVYGSHYFENKMNVQYRRYNGEFQTISRRYLSVDEEERIIKRFYPRFVALHNEGVIGREQRLNWLEVLRASGEELKLPGLTYEIASQSVYTPQFTVSLGRFQLFSSQMTLNMQLLHEEDLLRLLDFIDARAQGLFSVSECQLSRSAQGINMTPKAGNITGRCTLHWFSIKLSDGTEIEV
jgi:hypothetical protein